LGPSEDDHADESGSFIDGSLRDAFIGLLSDAFPGRGETKTDAILRSFSAPLLDKQIMDDLRTAADVFISELNARSSKALGATGALNKLLQTAIRILSDILDERRVLLIIVGKIVGTWTQVVL
jgi:hypothetical protein